MKGRRDQTGAYLFVVCAPLFQRVLCRLHYRNRNDLSVVQTMHVVVLPTVSGQSDLALPENHLPLAPTLNGIGREEAEEGRWGGTAIVL